MHIIKNDTTTNEYVKKAFKDVMNPYRKHGFYKNLKKIIKFKFINTRNITFSNLSFKKNQIMNIISQKSESGINTPDIHIINDSNRQPFSLKIIHSSSRADFEKVQNQRIRTNAMKQGSNLNVNFQSSQNQEAREKSCVSRVDKDITIQRDKSEVMNSRQGLNEKDDNDDFVIHQQSIASIGQEKDSDVYDSQCQLNFEDDKNNQRNNNIFSSKLLMLEEQTFEGNKFGLEEPHFDTTIQLNNELGTYHNLKTLSQNSKVMENKDKIRVKNSNLVLQKQLDNVRKDNSTNLSSTEQNITSPAHYFILNQQNKGQSNDRTSQIIKNLQSKYYLNQKNLLNRNNNLKKSISHDEPNNQNNLKSIGENSVMSSQQQSLFNVRLQNEGMFINQPKRNSLYREENILINDEIDHCQSLDQFHIDPFQLRKQKTYLSNQKIQSDYQIDEDVASNNAKVYSIDNFSYKQSKLVTPMQRDLSLLNVTASNDKQQFYNLQQE